MTTALADPAEWGDDFPYDQIHDYVHEENDK